MCLEIVLLGDFKLIVKKTHKHYRQDSGDGKACGIEMMPDVVHRLHSASWSVVLGIERGVDLILSQFNG